MVDTSLVSIHMGPIDSDRATQQPADRHSGLDPAQFFGDAATGSRIYRALIGGSAITTALVNADLTIAWVNESVIDLLGHPWHHYIGKTAIDLIHPDDLGAVLALITNELANPANYLDRADPARRSLNQLRFRHATQGWVRLEMSANNETANPEVNGFLLHLVASEHRATHDQVMEAILLRRPTTDIADMISDAVQAMLDDGEVLVQVEGHHTAASSELVTVAQHLAATKGQEFISEDKSVWRVAAELDGVEVGMIAVSVDVRLGLTMWTQTNLAQLAKLVAHLVRRDQLESRLSIEASCDPLTGLANRRTFFRRTESSHSKRHALLYIDLDGFKAINDALGHDVGDSALVEAAKRITSAVRPQDLVSRFGGDEFTVWCAIDDDAEAGEIAERIRSRLSNYPYAILNHVVQLQATIGVAVGGVHEVDDLLRRADLAMLNQKQLGKGTFALAAVN
jgi:diguanylate cyclase (GGDEF)-like protein